MLSAGHAQQATHQRFTPMASPAASERRFLPAVANLKTAAIHLHAGHLRSAAGRAAASFRQRQGLIGRSLLRHLRHTLLPDSLGPTLHPLSGHGSLCQGVQVLGRLNERRRSSAGIDHLLQHSGRERAVRLNADRRGLREKKPCDTPDKSIPARQG